jgi:hypothetical protein
VGCAEEGQAAEHDAGGGGFVTVEGAEGGGVFEPEGGRGREGAPFGGAGVEGGGLGVEVVGLGPEAGADGQSRLRGRGAGVEAGGEPAEGRVVGPVLGVDAEEVGEAASGVGWPVAAGLEGLVAQAFGEVSEREGETSAAGGTGAKVEADAGGMGNEAIEQDFGVAAGGVVGVALGAGGEVEGQSIFELEAVLETRGGESEEIEEAVVVGISGRIGLGEAVAEAVALGGEAGGQALSLAGESVLEGVSGRGGRRGHDVDLRLVERGFAGSPGLGYARYQGATARRSDQASTWGIIAF